MSFSVPPVLGLTESAVVLNAVNVLFAAFVLIQIPYLFGGQLNIDLGRTTYAEYARRGFGELVTTSVLVLGMLLVLGALTRARPPASGFIFNLSCTITVGLTLVMLVSAFKRLLLYEMAYGFTEMRIYPHVFMIWLALLLGWFLVTLCGSSPDGSPIGLLVACIGFVVTLNCSTWTTSSCDRTCSGTSNWAQPRLRLPAPATVSTSPAPTSASIPST